MLYHIFGNNQTETDGKQLFIWGLFHATFHSKAFSFQLYAEHPVELKELKWRQKASPPCCYKQCPVNISETDFIVCCSTKTNFWSSHCTLVALCSTQSASNAQREWRTAQHRNVFTHCSIQNQVLIVPSPNKKLCQLRALISTSAVGVLRIIEINLSPMCIFCIGKSSNVYIGLIQIERNNTRQYGKCRGKIFSN